MSSSPSSSKRKPVPIEEPEVMADEERRRAFGEALIEARLARRLTQGELVARLGGGTSSKVSEWEHGISEPRPHTVFAIEKALEVYPGSLARHLGYVPLEGAGCTLDAIVSADSTLPDAYRKALVAMYRSVVDAAHQNGVKIRGDALAPLGTAPSPRSR
jgi:transcriptional regulator with XRE-family HTH domain